MSIVDSEYNGCGQLSIARTCRFLNNRGQMEILFRVKCSPERTSVCTTWRDTLLLLVFQLDVQCYIMQGVTIKPLVKLLDVKTADKHQPSMNEKVHERVSIQRVFGVRNCRSNSDTRLGVESGHCRCFFDRFSQVAVPPYTSPWFLCVFRGSTFVSQHINEWKHFGVWLKNEAMRN